jgi:NADPH-dependent curcumin reductase CurA
MFTHTTLPTTSQTLILQHQVLNTISLTGLNPTFALKSTSLPATQRDIPPDSVLAKTLYFSNDPVARKWVQKGTGSVSVGEPMKAFALLRVVAVGGGEGEIGSELKEGDLVSGLSIWSEYAVLKKAELKKLK